MNLPCPRIDIRNATAVLFNKKYRTILLSVLGQILRNCIAHGIESSAIRRQKGKEAQGEIVITSSYVNDRHCIEIADDGRGIRLLDFIAEPQDLNLKTTRELRELAQQIFFAGHSTARKVSEISGRGIGLEMVKKSLNRINADIAVEVDGSIDAEGFLPIKFSITLGENMIVAVDSTERFVS